MPKKKFKQSKQFGFEMNPEMRAATYMAGKQTFALKPIPEGDRGKGLRKMAGSTEGANQVKEFGYDPATAMKPAYAMGNLDNLRNEKGVITPSAMKLDPQGFYTDYKVKTPQYLKDAGYGYNPDQRYSFEYTFNDGKETYRSDKPLSDEQFKASGYKLKSATYQPEQNYDALSSNPTSSKDSYNIMQPVTTNIPKQGDNISQKKASSFDNPYVSQKTNFKDGKQKDTRTRFSQRYNTQIFRPRGENYSVRGRVAQGGDMTVYTKPGESGSNVMSNFVGNDRLYFNFGSDTRRNKNDFSRYLNPSNQSVHDNLSTRYENRSLGEITSRINRAPKSAIRSSDGIGPAAYDFLASLKGPRGQFRIKK
tara:strand:- start:518 stop:1609 length:1092 start_codon:yes stop_codon:yes gene_type:complete